jgi:hypothetical protein
VVASGKKINKIKNNKKKFKKHISGEREEKRKE